MIKAKGKFLLPALKSERKNICVFGRLHDTNYRRISFPAVKLGKKFIGGKNICVFGLHNRNYGKISFPGDTVRKKIIGGKNNCISGLIHHRNYGKIFFPATKSLHDLMILPAGLFSIAGNKG